MSVTDESAQGAAAAPAAGPAAVAIQNLDEASLSALYGSQIEPQLTTFEGERKSAMGKFWTRILISIPVAVVVGGIVGAVFHNAGWAFGGGVAILVFGGAWAYGPLQEAESLKGWLDILDPPAPAPAKP